MLCEKHLVGKLVLECKDEILNTTEAFDNWVTSKKVLILFTLFDW